jgi:hypothetical protein
VTLIGDSRDDMTLYAQGLSHCLPSSVAALISVLRIVCSPYGLDDLVIEIR